MRTCTARPRKSSQVPVPSRNGMSTDLFFIGVTPISLEKIDDVSSRFLDSTYYGDWKNKVYFFSFKKLFLIFLYQKHLKKHPSNIVKRIHSLKKHKNKCLKT
jgi:hypothetical protein